MSNVNINQYKYSKYNNQNKLLVILITYRGKNILYRESPGTL